MKLRRAVLPAHKVIAIPDPVVKINIEPWHDDADHNTVTFADLTMNRGFNIPEEGYEDYVVFSSKHDGGEAIDRLMDRLATPLQIEQH